MSEQSSMVGIEKVHPTYRIFLQEKFSKAGASHQKQVLSLLRRLPAPDEITHEWVLDFLTKTSSRGRPLSNDSFINYLTRIRLLARWMGRMDLVEGIDRPHKRKSIADDVLSMTQIRQLIQHTRNSQTRALIHLMAESGVRIDEALSIRIEDITCDNVKIVNALKQNGLVSGRVWKLWISRGKTMARHIWAYHSTPSLLAWLLDHPLKTGSLFVGGREFGQWQPLTYSGAYGMITAAYVAGGYRDDRLAKSLRITLTRNPMDHELEKLLALELAKPSIPPRRIAVFRRAAAAEMVRERVNPNVICKMLGYTNGSSLQSVYLHFTEEDVKREILHRFGLDEQVEKTAPALESWQCPVCAKMNPPTSSICIHCPPKPVDEQVRTLQGQVDQLEVSRLERNLEIAEIVRGLIVGMKETMQ